MNEDDFMFYLGVGVAILVELLIVCYMCID